MGACACRYTFVPASGTLPRDDLVVRRRSVGDSPHDRDKSFLQNGTRVVRGRRSSERGWSS